MASLIQPASIQRVARQFARANVGFDAHAEVFRVVSDRLLSRLALLAIEPARVLDLGCRTGYQLPFLQKSFPDAQVIGVDPAPGNGDAFIDSGHRWSRFLRRPPVLVTADPHHLPLADSSIDLVVSNLLLPWCHAPQSIFTEVSRVLSPGGAFLFSSAGPDTLKEYFAAWATIDAYLHGFGLIDMHDLGDSMLSAGFAAPVLDRENMIIDYPSIDALQDELTQLGAANIAMGRRRGLMSPDVRQYLRNDVAAGKRFPVTFELVQGHAWKGDLNTAGESNSEGFVISLDALRKSLKR